MNVNTLRFADRRIGGPICRLLTILRHLGRLLHHRTDTRIPHRVVVIKLTEMGSTVLAYPALAQLRRRIPNLELFFLSFDEFGGIFDELGLGPAERTLRVDTSSTWRMCWTGWRAIRRLRALQVDTAIDMDFFSRFSVILAFLACPRGIRVGFHRFTSEGLHCGNLLTHPVLYSAHIHTSQAFMALVEALFTPHLSEVYLKQPLGGHDYTLPSHVSPPSVVESVTRKLSEARIPPTPGVSLVLVNPNSSALFPLRKWPARHYIEFCRRLLAERTDVRIAVTGGPDEKREAETLAQQVGSNRCVSFAGATSLPELLGLYTLARLMVTNDSGPAHFASLTPLRTIVLFGPETPQLYAPLGGRATCLYKAFACSPCVSVYNAKHSPCQNNRCLQAITVDEVLNEARVVLTD